MQCFSLAWLMQMLILCVIVGGVIAILQIIIPYALSKLGATIGEGARIVVRVFKIVLWCAVAILVIIIVFGLIACLISMGGGLHLPALPR
jgi:uncharacterized membrane protein